MGKKPVPTPIVVGQRPVVSRSQQKAEWVFSFKHFSQVENFGLSSVRPSWFVSVLDRLRDLCTYEVETLHKNRALQAELRYHPVDWTARNIPIARRELVWVDKDIIDNEEEFVFYQFHISKALGRVIGFWYENVFHIVLLDASHNMQPSKYNDYKIRSNVALENDVTAILLEIDAVKRVSCNDSNCQVKSRIMAIPARTSDSNALLFFLEDVYLERLESLSKTHSLSEILELGILAIQA